MKARTITVTTGELEIAARDAQRIRKTVDAGRSPEATAFGVDVATAGRGDGEARDYVIVEDGGREIWRGWLDGEPGEAPDTDVRALYRERASLVAYLAACYPSVIVTGADPDAPDWPVLFVQTPTGQMTWHLAAADLDLFGHVGQVPAGAPAAPKWDGHGTGEKYRRLAQLAGMTALEHGDIRDSIAELESTLAETGESFALVARMRDKWAHRACDLKTAIAGLAGEWEREADDWDPEYAHIYREHGVALREVLARQVTPGNETGEAQDRRTDSGTSASPASPFRSLSGLSADAEHHRCPKEIHDCPRNAGKPVTWTADLAPGGWVCAFPENSPAGICGYPLDGDEPCPIHTATIPGGS